MEREYISPEQQKIIDQHKRELKEQREKIERKKTPQMREAV